MRRIQTTAKMSNAQKQAKGHYRRKVILKCRLDPTLPMKKFTVGKIINATSS